MTYVPVDKCKATEADGRMTCLLCLTSWGADGSPPSICLNHGNDAMKRPRAPVGAEKTGQDRFYQRRKFRPEGYPA